MPVSDYSQISPIIDQVVKINPKTILDAGCGLGIYGSLCRIYLEGDNLYDRANLTWNKKENWNVKIDCIEGFEKYITDLHRAVYNGIFIGDAQNILKGFEDKAYELVLAIDILEHLKKEDGIAFIKSLQRIGENVIIATPAEFIKQVVPENTLEDHLSFWNKEELQSSGFNIVEETSSLIGLYRSPGRQGTAYRDSDT
jgi:2-polyprenyl-3-methyl-5-hydroxy-6-metoxy-1,4-benzoquinol methylase